MKLIYDVGINDLPRGCVSYRNNSNVTIKHLFYSKWSEMLRRCYSKKFHQRNLTYFGCSVCEEWKTLSKFKEWFDRQPEERHSWQLDKDLLFQGNQVYSPEMCILVPHWLNSFVSEHTAGRGQYMLGVYFHKATSKYLAKVCDGTGKQKHLGLFSDELSAHLAWKTAKLQMVHDMKDELNQIDYRLYDALVKRYS